MRVTLQDDRSDLNGAVPHFYKTAEYPLAIITRRDDHKGNRLADPPRGIGKGADIVRKAIFAPALVLFSLSSMGLSAQEKATPPDADQLRAATKLVMDVFREEFSAARTSAQKFTLANRLFREAVETPGPHNRYALLHLAKGIYAELKEYDYVLAILDTLTQLFATDTSTETLAVLEEASSSTRGAPANRQLYQTLQRRLNSALKADDYATALRLSKLMERVSGRTSNRELQASAKKLSKEIEEWSIRYEKIATNLTTGETSTASSETKTELGRYFCFLKGDWQTGLPLLNAGSDEKLREYASAELDSSSNFITIGDQWWEFAEGLEEISGEIVRRHAAEWYDKGLPQLSGLQKSRVEKRLFAWRGDPTITGTLSAPGKFVSVIAEDQHAGSAGAKHVDNIYTLTSFVDHPLAGARIRFRAYPNGVNSSNGDIFLSIDDQDWIKISEWTNSTSQAAKKFDNWYELVLVAAEQRTAQQLRLKFVYTSGDRHLIIEAAEWVR